MFSGGPSIVCSAPNVVATRPLYGYQTRVDSDLDILIYVDTLTRSLYIMSRSHQDLMTTTTKFEACPQNSSFHAWIEGASRQLCARRTRWGGDHRNKRESYAMMQSPESFAASSNSFNSLLLSASDIIWTSCFNILFLRAHSLPNGTGQSLTHPFSHLLLDGSSPTL